MAKYYVESGELRVMVQARGPVAAAARALSWVTEQDRLDPWVTVNERGFIADRSNPRLDSSDVALETGTLLGLILEHEL